MLFLTSSTTPWLADDAKRLLALIDYIGSDYRNAFKAGKSSTAPESTQDKTLHGSIGELTSH